MPTKRKKTTKYQRLQKAATNHCKQGSAASRDRLKKAEKVYIEDAKKKGKSASEIRSIVSRTKKCPTGIGKTKRTKRKTTRRKRK